MKRFGTILAVLLFVAIIFGSGYGILSGYKLLSFQWNLLDIHWKASMIIMATIFMVCALFVSASIRSYIKKHGLTSTGKVFAYNEFINWYSNLKNSSPDTMKAKFFKEVKNQINLWGSNPVVKQTNLLFENLQRDKENSKKVLRYADQVYLEIKKELGHRNYRIDRSII
jgi:hypothetical protein